MATKRKKPARARPHEGRVYQRGGSWAIRWTDPDGSRQYAGGYLDEGDAEKVRKQIAANVAKGLPGLDAAKPVGPVPTFGKLVDDFFDDRERDGHRSIQDDRARWARYLAPLLSPRQIDSVDSGQLDDLVRDLRKPPLGQLDPDGQPMAPISGATAQRVLHLLSAFFAWAIMHGHAVRNPVRELTAKMGRKAKERLRSKHDPRDTPYIQKKEDVGKVFRALPHPVNLAYALCALAGLRPGEALALRWLDVDLAKAEIQVRRQVRHGRLDVPKSGKGRAVPIVPSLLAVLTEAHKAAGHELVVPPTLYPAREGEAPKPRGKWLNGRTITAALKTALEAAGLPAMTFYQAGRHTFASQWVLAGLSVFRLSKILGHSSVKVTERYAHLVDKLTEDEASRADVPLAG